MAGPNYAALFTLVYSSAGPPPVLAAAFTGMSQAQIIAAVNATTVSSSGLQDTNGAAVGGVLEARGSYHRVRLNAQKTLTGNVATDLPVAICQNLMDVILNDRPIPMSEPAIASAIERDMAALQAAKLSDNHGILYAAAELSATDPGDAAVLLAQLANSIPWWEANGFAGPVVVADLATALQVQ